MLTRLYIYRTASWWVCVPCEVEQTAHSCNTQFTSNEYVKKHMNLQNIFRVPNSLFMKQKPVRCNVWHHKVL
jgi:hypothetical protein